MKQLVLSIVITLCALPAFGQSRAGIIVDLEGVRRSNVGPVTGTTRYEPAFDNGGGLGVGINWHLSDRFSVEGKVAALRSKGTLRIIAPDHIANTNIDVNMLPVMLTAQWHPFQGTALRPYVGVGLAHVITENIEATNVSPAIEFDDPSGLLVNAGVRVSISDKWSFNADARYIPVETQGSITFVGTTTSGTDIDVRPLVVGFGIVYHY